MSSPHAGLWAVADGMGGYEAGNIASNMIARSLEEVSRQQQLSDFVDSVEDRIIDANHRILEYAEIMHEGRTLGSTVVSLLIKGQAGVCLWVGDSRLYRFRNNELQQLSRDHSQVEELLQQGLITLDEAIDHPESNVITRAVGTSEELYVDIIAFSVQVGDTFLLCSDGLYNAVGEVDIIDCINQDDIDAGVKRLIEIALENKASDNVSTIIVRGGPVQADNN